MIDPSTWRPTLPRARRYNHDPNETSEWVYEEGLTFATASEPAVSRNDNASIPAAIKTTAKTDHFQPHTACRSARVCLRCARRIAPRSSSVRFRIASRSCGTRRSALRSSKSRRLATRMESLPRALVQCTTHTARGLRSTRYKGATCRGLHSAWAVVCKAKWITKRWE